MKCTQLDDLVPNTGVLLLMQHCAADGTYHTPLTIPPVPSDLSDLLYLIATSSSLVIFFFYIIRLRRCLQVTEEDELRERVWWIESGRRTGRYGVSRLLVYCPCSSST